MQLRVEVLEFGVIERMSLVRRMGLIGQMEMRVWLRDVLKIPRFVILLLLFVTTWDVSPLFERFVVFICI